MLKAPLALQNNQNTLDHTSEFNELENQYELSCSDMEKYEKLVQQLVDENNIRIAENTRLKSTLDRLETQLEHSKEEAAILRKDLLEKSRKNEDLKQRLSQLQKEIEEKKRLHLNALAAPSPIHRGNCYCQCSSCLYCTQKTGN